ncbi:MAG: 4-hydroxy-tetrahydrodipicolinate reductase [Clostridiales Family XIII bacterium]|jgi:4-hydroxy-tetrahydrodipicolinate reductase|nr:4-hydroxy-tetrahydrodipicolinate reductase [Clostridiales Family XIII bacterium]
MNVIINGIYGRMGRAVLAVAMGDPNVNIVCGIDAEATTTSGATTMFRGTEIPVYGSCVEFTGEADVIIDFSHYTAIPALIDYATARTLPTVVCTTGLGEEEYAKLSAAAVSIPVFNSPNMSLGVAVLKKMVQMATPALERDFNIEIVEAHHNMKKDSPSGTALMLADAINEKCETQKDYIYGRHGTSDEVKTTDLGIHAVRGGTMPGRHTVLFAGPDETIEVTHTAYSRDIFALGALNAARYIQGRPPGLYMMDDLV